MSNFATALHIAYPLRDPVVSDTARYLDAMDRRDAEVERIAEIVADLRGTDDGFNTIMSEPEMEHHAAIALRILVRSKIGLSKEQAIKEFEIAFKVAAHRVAGRMLAEEIKQAKEDAAVAAYERRQERCESWA
jgi:hypothetical protein